MGPQVSLDFKNIFESGLKPVLVLLPDDPKFTIIAVNQGFERQLKMKREEILGRGVFEAFPANPNEPSSTGIEKTRASYRRVIQYRAPDTLAIIKYNIRNPKIDGDGFEEHFWSVVNCPVFNSEGELIYIIVQPEDVTELMRLKVHGIEQTMLTDELQSDSVRMQSEIFLASRLYADSQKAIRDREYVLSIVSHDLKNPLSTIKLVGQILSKNELDSKEVLPLARGILQSTEIMERLILDLLDFEKIQSGTLLLKKDSESIIELINAAMESVAPLALEKKIKLLIDLPSTDVRISCDKSRIIQVLWNLIGNAIKFTSENGEVRVIASKIGDRVEFSVIDTGPGIATEKIPKVFDRFWQAKETGNLGTGLGLSIVKGIIESHGGKIWIESHEGQGSQFHFTIETIDHAWKASTVAREESKPRSNESKSSL